jgi:hypothetical protein
MLQILLELVADIRSIFCVQQSFRSGRSLKDRFVIMDVLGDDATFRNKVTLQAKIRCCLLSETENSFKL